MIATTTINTKSHTIDCAPSPVAPLPFPVGRFPPPRPGRLTFNLLVVDAVSLPSLAVIVAYQRPLSAVVENVFEKVHVVPEYDAVPASPSEELPPR